MTRVLVVYAVILGCLFSILYLAICSPLLAAHSKASGSECATVSILDQIALESGFKATLTLDKSYSTTLIQILNEDRDIQIDPNYTLVKVYQLDVGSPQSVLTYFDSQGCLQYSEVVKTSTLLFYLGRVHTRLIDG
jgi:hypothetical protein